MALWGKTDNLAGKPKFVARKCLFDSTAVSTTAETIDLATANTNFATGDAVYYSINGGTVIGGLVDTTIYYVRRIDATKIALYDTQAHALDTGSTTGRLNITGAGVGQHILQKTLAVANTNDGTYPSKVLVFVDQTEAQKTSNKAKGFHGGGWYLYSTYTDAQSTTRHKAEMLVELQVVPGTSGDAEDSIAADVTITIGTQPENVSVTAPATATFSVVATASATIPTAVLGYQWQIQQEGSGDWANITGATSASYTTGATATGDGAGATDGDKYRVIVSVTNLSGVDTVTSDAATLTVS